VLEDRLRARAGSGADPSDADLAVLDHQRKTFVAPQRHAIHVDTSELLDESGLAALVERLLGARS
jgi:predicted kinase